jgi:hypothetical protein
MNQEASLCRGQMVFRYERTNLLHIAEELRCHILSFLPYNQILRCALVGSPYSLFSYSRVLINLRSRLVERCTRQ